MQLTRPTELDLSTYSSLCRDCSELSGTGLAPHPSHLRLRSWNDVDHHHTALNRSWLSRVGLSGLEAGLAWKRLARRINNKLFPRRDRIHGNPSPYHSITGRLTFGKERDDIDKPMHHMHVELWGRTVWGAYRKLQQGHTDRQGRFELHYDLDYCSQWWLRKIWIGFYHTGHHHFNQPGMQEPEHTLFRKLDLRKSDLIGLELFTGTTRLFYWEYRDDTTLPRVVIRDHDKDAPDRYPEGRLNAIEHMFIPIELIKVKHLETIRFAPTLIDHARIQADYPPNLTTCMEKKIPGITRSDNWFGERMMNGMYGADLDRDPHDPELYWIHHHWNSYDKDLHTYAMPDVDMWFRLKPNGSLMPVRIALTGALRATDTTSRSKHVFHPQDGAKWQAAKRVARVSAALNQELAHHFAGTHLNMEQYAIAAFRNLRFSPVAGLLKPHLRGVVLINHSADRMLLGNGYISTACALTPKGMDQMMEKTLGTLDWKGFRPMEPISPNHRYAKAANLYWDLVHSFVTGFLDEPATRERTLEHWFEIHRFSEDLVDHSAPAFLCHYLHGALLDHSGKPKEGHGHGWYQTRQRMDLHDERPMSGQQERAISQITRVSESREVTETDLAHLKQVCTYIIFQSTFGHTWGNSLQSEDIGEVMYSSLGIRYGSTEEGILGPETDVSIAPDLIRSTQMLWWSNMLSRTRYGTIMANEEKDIHPALIEALEAKRQDFEAVGFDIDKIQTGINI